ncbi:hypothetical protein ABPG75_009549 [Micractinium tetrahymenae]
MRQLWATAQRGAALFLPRPNSLLGLSPHPAVHLYCDARPAAQRCACLAQPAAMFSGQAAAAAPGSSAAPAAPATPAPLDDERFMRLALEQAAAAAAADEVPVGAVLVSSQGEVLAAARNETEGAGDPTAHAEMLCLRAAAARAGGWRLLDATLYVTLEPCPMCAGALLQARVGTVVYGARNTLLGADGSWISMLPQGEAASLPSSCNGCGSSGDQPSAAGSTAAGAATDLPPGPGAPARPHPFHPNMVVRRGVLAEECAALLKAFFARRRREAVAAKAAAAGSKGGDGGGGGCSG